MAKREKNLTNNKIIRFLVFVLSILIVLLIWSLRHSLRGWRRLGYLGLFLVNLVSSSTVFVPLPGVATVFLSGAIWRHPVIIGVISGAGAAIGELTGYFLGYGGRGITVKKKRAKNHWLTRFEGFFHANGFITILIFALLPLPFDFIGVLAGAMEYPVWKFILATFLGRSIRNTIIAWSGAKVLPL